MKTIGQKRTHDENKLAKFHSAAIDAKVKGGDDLRDFLVKNLDCWTTTGANSLVSIQDWTACGTDKTLADYEGSDCYIGIDLSSKNDLTTVAILVPDERPYIYTHSFLPEHKLDEHIRRDNAPYDVWYKNGLIDLTNGPGTYGVILDYKYILQWIRQTLERYKLNVLEVGYDQSNAATMLPELAEIVSCDLTEVGQYPKSLSDATQNFRDTVRARAVEYDRGNELMSWSVVNTVVAQNIYQQIIADKVRGRIDPVDAVMDAWKLYFLNRGQEPDMTYEESMESWRDINAILGKL